MAKPAGHAQVFRLFITTFKTKTKNLARNMLV